MQEYTLAGRHQLRAPVNAYCALAVLEVAAEVMDDEKSFVIENC